MENKKGSNKVWLIFIGLILLLSIIGGSFYLSKDKFINKPNTKEIEKDKEEQKEKATPLLYEVIKNEEDTKIYLFGSIHAADGRAYPMQDKILDAFKTSKYLAVEFDVVAFERDFSLQMELVKMLLCENGKSLKDYLSPEGYEIIIKYMKDNNIYNEAYEMYKPGMIYSLISNVTIDKSNLKSNKGIDMYFLKKAKRSKKKILEVESAESQIQLLSTMPNEVYELMIRSYISEEEQEIASLKEMYEAWLTGDIAKYLDRSKETDLDKIRESLSEEEKIYFDKIIQLLNTYNESLLNNRNNSMTTVVDNYFKEEKNVFVVVGAAHVVGETGLVNELKKLGYTVNQVEY